VKGAPHELMRDGGGEPPIRRASGLTTARKIVPHATSQERNARKECGGTDARGIRRENWKNSGKIQSE
jgi:hypothetical protein